MAERFSLGAASSARCLASCREMNLFQMKARGVSDILVGLHEMDYVFPSESQTTSIQAACEGGTCRGRSLRGLRGKRSLRQICPPASQVSRGLGLQCKQKVTIRRVTALTLGIFSCAAYMMR